MEQNFTPLDIASIKKSNTTSGMVFLTIITFTALVLALMLFILIQKRIGAL